MWGWPRVWLPAVGDRDSSPNLLTGASRAGWLSLEGSPAAAADQTEGGRHALGRPR